MSDFVSAQAHVSETERRLKVAVEDHERRQALFRRVCADVLALPLCEVRERIIAAAATAQDGCSLTQIGNTLKLLDEVANAVAEMDGRLRAERMTGAGAVLGNLVGAGLGAAFGAR